VERKLLSADFEIDLNLDVPRLRCRPPVAIPTGVGTTPQDAPLPISVVPQFKLRHYPHLAQLSVFLHRAYDPPAV
jgi:hypothetical protein